MSLRWLVYGLLILLAISATLGICMFVLRLDNGRPQTLTPAYEEYTHAFQLGLAALDSDLLQQAEEQLKRCTQLVPEESAAWANLGLLYLRTGQLEKADKYLLHARELSPKAMAIEKLIVHLRQRQGRFDESAEILRKIVKLAPNDTQSLYQLIQVIDQQSDSNADQEQRELLDRLLSIDSQNLRLLVDKLRLALKTDDEVGWRSAQTSLDKLKTTWDERTVKAWGDLTKFLVENPKATNSPALLKFSNTLLAETIYIRDLSKLEDSDAFVGQPIENYLWLEALVRQPAAADLNLQFSRTPLANNSEVLCTFAFPFWESGDGQVKILRVSDRALYLGDKTIEFDPGKAPTLPGGVICFDADNDLLTDIFIASGSGLQLFRNRTQGSFEDATSASGLELATIRGSYSGGCSTDFDLDGDLDVMLYAKSSSPLILRNNFDGTFTALNPFNTSSPVKSSAWADIDCDGATDVVLLDSERQLQMFSNQRSGKFVAWQALPPSEQWLAITCFDATNDGRMDIVGVNDRGEIIALSDADKQTKWFRTSLGKIDGSLQSLASEIDIRLMEADLDNNGATDLLLSSKGSSRVWLSEPNGKFVQSGANVDASIYGIDELDGDGRLDLLAVNESSQACFYKNVGTKSYHWLDLRLRASRGKLDGDNRINSFGIGGTIELRAGSFITTQIIQKPTVHLGLGNNAGGDVVRVLWPNGTFQYEFTPVADQILVATQRLKGSCPFLYAWDGNKIQFVTDFMWSTPLGMFINASDKGGFLQTTDWVKIAADQLKPRDGNYELRVNANLWETHYFDQVALKVVDHPADMHLVVDEKFYMEPNAPQLHWVRLPRAIESVYDHQGRDVSRELAVIDANYLDVGRRGRYQGLMDEHWIEFDIEPNSEGPEQWLLARGWIHPTDSSVNYAIAQGQHAVPHGLVLERLLHDGSWQLIEDRLGFPAGKNKTIVVPLKSSDAHLSSGSQTSRRFRLRTNMEIYWDWIALAEPVNSATFHAQPLHMIEADLTTRGIVEMVQATTSSPELPVYERLIARGQYWRDLIGYHTRPGDIRELLANVDDRYAILTAGDEVVLRFAEPPAPPDGWIRDFVWISDGWVKDGDFNTRYGKTVLPLPYHKMPAYVGNANQLESDPVYQRFPGDWQQYHTRFVNTFEFDRGLRRTRSYQLKDASR